MRMVIRHRTVRSHAALMNDDFYWYVMNGDDDDYNLFMCFSFFVVLGEKKS